MENPIKMDDLGGPPLFLETPIYSNFGMVYSNFVMVDSSTIFMAGQPTPPEVRPYDQGLLTIGLP